jgi:hypothetical protein
VLARQCNTLQCNAVIILVFTEYLFIEIEGILCTELHG